MFKTKVENYISQFFNFLEIQILGSHVIFDTKGLNLIYSRLCLKRTVTGPDNLSTKDRGPLKTE